MADGTISPLGQSSLKRHYCCVCSNFRGKVVDQATIALHRFPSEKLLQKAWLRRIRAVSSSFKFSEKNDRLCSAHFKDGKFDRKSQEHRIPSVFILADGSVKKFEQKLVCELSTPICDTDLNHVKQEQEEQEEYQNLTLETSVAAYEQVSVQLHDYVGSIDVSSFSDRLPKAVQTDSCEGTTTCSSQTEPNLSFNKPEKRTQTRTFGTQTETATETRSFGAQVQMPDLTIEDIKNNDMCLFYTGVPNVETFNLLFDDLDDAEFNTQRTGNGENQGRPRVLRLIDEFFLVLMRFRLGLLLEDLAGRFHISKSTCCNITSQWTLYLSVKLSSLVPWPSKLTITETMPLKFKRKYPNCRVIIDCTEFYTQTPQSLINKSLMYSHYKSHMTWKALLGISPSGIITFVSDLWTGNISDKQITKNSGILDLCQPGDAIMADKGFLISDLTTPRQIQLIIPPLKIKRFNRREIEKTRRIANLRIDVERAIERVKNFRILQGVMPITLSGQATNILKICAGLSNLLPPLVQDS